MPDTLESPARPAVEEWQAATEASVGTHDDYRPFDEVESRNRLQERIELPLLFRALRLPRGGRVLEVGCGRGVALPALAERLAPDELVGMDVNPVLLEHARDSLAALNEISRVLRVGGLFVHETPFAQRLAHPVRSLRVRLPFTAVPMLKPDRSAVLWGVRRRVGSVLV